MAIKTTAIRAPTKELDNHTIVLRQLKETTEVSQRLRGDPTKSFVTVQDLISAGLIRFVDNTVQPPNTTNPLIGGTLELNKSDTVTTAPSAGAAAALPATPAAYLLITVDGKDYRFALYEP